MDIYEYQAKQLLKHYGIRIPSGGIAGSAEQAATVAQALQGPTRMVKAQIHAGGRGKAGGIKKVHSVEEVRTLAGLMLGERLITSQTLPEGQEIRQVYIEQGIEVLQSFYFALLIDTIDCQLTFIISPEMGNDSIAEIAVNSPERVLRLSIEPETGFDRQQCQQLIDKTGLAGELASAAVDVMQSMYRAFTELDASLIEISPLVVSTENQLLALDVKMSFDDNALFRQPDIRVLRDYGSNDKLTSKAAQVGLNYIRLDGNVGTLVSGAGLALATLDALHEQGIKAANFLDIPPRAKRSDVSYAFKLLLDDQRLQIIVVNVFGGGIMRCDVIADGLVDALQNVLSPSPPAVIVCLAGVDAELGREILLRSQYSITVADNLASAATKAAELNNNTTKTTKTSLLSPVKKFFSRASN